MLLAGFVLPRAASGYNEAIHSLLDERAPPADLLDMPLTPPTLGDVELLRRELWRAGSTHPDAGVRARFLARYPVDRAFDLWALKEFLGLNPDKQVVGLDVMPDLGAAPTVRAVLALGARLPDDDGRNQERFAHDVDRKVRRDRWGRPLPADPAQLGMGPLEGKSSQAYAHYGLPKLEFSDSMAVLKKEARRFLSPPDAKAFGPDFAQMHTDLALCAATLGTPGGGTLGWLYVGNSHHYLEDVANQIHTLQAIYDFGFDAKIASLKEELFSLGGLLRSRPDFRTIAVGIIRNHHLFGEDLFAKRVAEQVEGKRNDPRIAAALDAIGRGDGELEQALDARKLDVDAPFGRLITEEIIAASSREGAEVYQMTRAIAQRRLSRVGVTFDDDDPDLFLKKDAAAEALDRFYRLQAAGFARAGSGLRRHVQLYRAALEPSRADDVARRARFDTSARRLVTSQLEWLDARDARLAAYEPTAPTREQINWFVPGGLLAILLIAWVVIRAIRKHRAARRAARAAAS